MSKIFLSFGISTLLLLLILQSCREYRIKDLTDKISFSEQICENDSAIFSIQHIRLIDVERNPNVSIESVPEICLHVLIKNKLYDNLQINASFKYSKSNFVGILKNGGDTVNFRNDFLRTFFVPQGDTIIEVYSKFPFWFDFDEGGDNTELMLAFLKEMDFYYVPLADNSLDTNNYVLHNRYCLGLSPETKISSKSQIRVK